MAPRKQKVQDDDQPGLVATWSCKSADGQMLKWLVESGFADGLTASTLMTKHTQFAKYRNDTLNSALANTRRSYAGAVMDRDSGVNRTYSA
jgi:hypothetical protein